MPSTAAQVCAKAWIGKVRLQIAIAAAWSRLSNDMGKGLFADKTGDACHAPEPRAIQKA